MKKTRNNMYFRIFALFFILYSSNSHADLWQAKDILHRDQGPTSSSCDHFRQNPTAVFDEYKDSKLLKKDFRRFAGKTKDSETAEGRIRKQSIKYRAVDPTRCYLQKHEGKFRNSEYHLAFLEFNGKGELRKPAQFHDLTTHLERSSKNVVLVYVHGWRYDANVGNKDVRRFNMMLGYTRRNMEYRCRSKGRYCNHKLTGIYVGWPGRTWADKCHPICAPVLALSAKGSKKTSENISDNVFEHLQSIEQLLGSRDNFHKKPWNRNVFVAMGHSFGGNLLANAVKSRAINDLDNHQPGDRIQGPLGDLVVLFNPASDAKNWIDIQKKIREINGIESSWLNLGDTPKAIGVHRRFSDTQPPVYMAISAPCGSPRFATNEEKRNYYNRAHCDKAVSIIFPVNQVVRSGKVRNRNRIAIGHFEPDGTCAGSSKEVLALQKLGCPKSHKKKPEFYGVTHELGIQCNRDLPGDLCDTPASLFYALSGEVKLGSKDDLAACAIADSWLYNARKWQKKRVSPTNKISTTKWNSGLNRAGKPIYNDHKTINRLHPKRPIYAQFAHSIYLQKGRFDITSGNDPYWNVRATESSVIDHGGFSNVKLLCAINQIFLDQVSQPN